MARKKEASDDLQKVDVKQLESLAAQVGARQEKILELARRIEGLNLPFLVTTNLQNTITALKTLRGFCTKLESLVETEELEVGSPAR